MRMRVSMTVSDLDFDNLADPEEAKELHRYGHPDERFANRIRKENRHVLRIDHVQNRKQYERQGRQQVSGHSSLRGVNPDLAANREPCPDHAGQGIQDLGEVAADLPLDEYGRYQDSHIHQIYPVSHAEQRVLQRQPESLLLEHPAELAGYRFGSIIRGHLEAGRERVTSTEGPAYQVNRFGQQLLKGVEPL